MQNFDYLKNGDIIGVCAPSMGCEGDYYLKRCDNAVKTFKRLGHEVVFSKHAFGNKLVRSALAKQRAEDFTSMFLNSQIKGIISMAGGEFEQEILPYIDFNKIKKAKNKFFQGFSDNTCLTFLLTTLCDKISIYGTNFCTFGMSKWHESLKNNYDFLCGKNVVQTSFKKYEEERKAKEPGKELLGFNITKSTHPVCLSGQKNFTVKGIALGGCLDVLMHIVGTKFDKVKDFVKKHKRQGIIWYLESCDINILEQSRAIWTLKQAGWFDGAKAVIIGRPLNKQSLFDCDYKTCNYENLQDLNIPVVIDSDIGHTSPNWFIANGAFATYTFDNNQASISFKI